MLGSGPIRIGQGIEFDYCSVRAALELRAAGVGSILVNSNPETVSTDFDMSDRLYFEPLDVESVLNILENEAGRQGIHASGRDAVRRADGYWAGGPSGGGWRHRCSAPRWRASISPRIAAASMR